jgi:hypothetical protein
LANGREITPKTTANFRHKGGWIIFNKPIYFRR